MFAMRDKMVPMVGEWSMPQTDSTNVAPSIMGPGTDIEVGVPRGKGLRMGSGCLVSGALSDPCGCCGDSRRIGHRFKRSSGA